MLAGDVIWMTSKSIEIKLELLLLNHKVNVNINTTNNMSVIFFIIEYLGRKIDQFTMNIKI